MSETKNGNASGNSPTPPVNKKERSPAYPAIDLRTAIERARQFYTFAKRNSARTTDAMKNWSFSEKSSGGRMVISALLKFGLLEEEGRGEDRHIRLSRLALDILLDERPDSVEKADLIKRAALRPKIHAHLWEKYGNEPPSEVILRTYLKRDLAFTDTAVDDLITEYKDTIEFANLTGGDKIEAPDEAAGGLFQDAPSVQIGNLVQWASGGADQFDPPRPVLGFSPDGDYAFVPGTSSGIPVSQLTVVGNAMNMQESKMPPPPNPFANTGVASPKSLSDVGPSAGVKEDVYDLVDGRALLRYPEKLDAESIAELEEWFGLIIRKMRRTNSIPAKANPNKPTGQ